MRACCLLVAYLSVISARLLHSLPEDSYAFPKFRVSFLNGLPVLNETAERWMRDGLRGGEQEFLDQPWKEGDWHTPSHLKEIGSGDATEQKEPTPQSSVSANYTLEHMKMGQRDSYLCLIPKPLDNIPTVPDDDSDADVTPARSWSLLQPLAGTCLYHRQGWFTYSYCHNDEIRQFKEVVPAQSRFPGTQKPEEDPGWDSYTLGRAPQNPEPGADLTVAEQNAQTANLELARSAGSRYLVQRWGDGSICDKTLQNREVEVQFHCSMEMTDHILFVKETKTCSYVVVIHTPRLCGEPGFKSRRDAGGEAEIRCREVVDTIPEGQIKLPTTDHPVKVPLRKTVLPAVPVPKGSKDDPLTDKEKIFNDLLRKTLEAIVRRKDGKPIGYEEDELVIELADDAEDEVLDSDRLVDALRAAGYNVQAEVVFPRLDKSKSKIKSKDDKQPDKSKKQAGKQYNPRRDEL
ncbi:hypothetical protein GALMADRAFT_239520 [Galerina marginata CBS 339.88]|uniref:Protein OS-9 homolog n=1 Tax=Galerina marginata (strain CBS 339.88) TaxID=685588 RepID=A0A067TE91_GALM3|nr:hypothetical protein GALMADRAFT_239520 [Galerina marginata CBS 339.88]